VTENHVSMLHLGCDQNYHTPVTVPVALDCASTPAAARTEATEKRKAERILNDVILENVDMCVLRCAEQRMPDT